MEKRWIKLIYSTWITGSWKGYDPHCLNSYVLSLSHFAFLTDHIFMRTKIEVQEKEYPHRRWQEQVAILFYQRDTGTSMFGDL